MSSVVGYLVAFLESVPVGIFIGLWAPKKLRSRNLSWTWAPVLGIGGIVIDPTGRIGMASGVAMVVAMLAYAFAEITGKGMRGNDPITPLHILKYRATRLVLSAYSITVLVSASASWLLYVAIGVVLLGVWVWHESEKARDRVTDLKEQVTKNMKDLLHVVNQ